eukprot:3937746-Rhodomonas_salina.5
MQSSGQTRCPPGIIGPPAHIEDHSLQQKLVVTQHLSSALLLPTLCAEEDWAVPGYRVPGYPGIFENSESQPGKSPPEMQPLALAQRGNLKPLGPKQSV